MTAQHMIGQSSPGVAHYTGNVRLWQGDNVVRAPKIDFDDQKRSIVAESDPSQKVSSLFMQQGQDGKLTPVDVTSDRLTYVDEERRARLHRQCLRQKHHRTPSAPSKSTCFLKQARRTGRLQPPVPLGSRRRNR